MEDSDQTVNVQADLNLCRAHMSEGMVSDVALTLLCIYGSYSHMVAKHHILGIGHHLKATYTNHCLKKKTKTHQ